MTPELDGGRWPIKRIVGDRLVVEADIFRDGHEALRAALRWRRRPDGQWLGTPMTPVDDDRWRGECILPENARYEYTIEAWTDRFVSWRNDFTKKVRAGREAASDLIEGIALIEQAGQNAAGAELGALSDTLARMRALVAPADALQIVSSVELEALMAKLQARPDLVEYEPVLEVVADRPKALFNAWYEMFPRSQGSTPGKAATLGEAKARLLDIRAMGFDVVYLPPIHPIGKANRKGPNNRLAPAPDSPGSPWAIGSEAGGHTAVEPSLGTLSDFEHFVAAAGRLGMEVALDFAIQCSPDHPWVRRHPEWFNHRTDGTIKYAENPPKEYQDIYPLNFDTPDYEGLRRELLRVVLFWVERGVRIFRVDNPHTKPVVFWRWLIEEVQLRHPDAIFLSEAFTRPKMMKVLAKAGFSQSYTYFTWRNTKAELTDYLTELNAPAMLEYFRPNFFTNTPDILSPVLQRGGRPAFKMRLVLAATLSPSYGIYSGYELCENEAVAGTEEYLHSEKYEIRTRDWNRPGNIKEFIARVNAIRRENPALQHFGNLRFLDADSDQIICYLRRTPDLGNVILVAVNLDPCAVHECTVVVPPHELGVAPGAAYRVNDLLSGASYTWSGRNYVRLDPETEPAHVFRVDRHP